MSRNKLDQLIKGLKIRDPKTLKAIYTEFYPKVLGYIISRGGNDHDAKDVFQESIIAVYKLLEGNKLDIQEDFGSFIIGIAKRLWLKHIRSADIHKRYIQQSNPEETEDHPSDIELEDEIELNLIRKYILNLGEVCRNILLWSAEGISNDEIAKRMHYKSEKTVRTKKHKCKGALIDMIKQDPKFFSK